MIGFDHAPFWAAVLVAVLGLRLTRPSGAVRQGVYLGLTGVIVALSGFTVVLPLVAVCVYAFAALRFLGGNQGVLVHSVLISAVFVGSQHMGGFVPETALEGLIPIVGLPYVYLRFLHLLFEVKNERMQAPGLLEFFTYMLPFHQILVGPIERYASFQKQMQAPLAPLDLDTALVASARITTGLVKKGVLAELLRRIVLFEADGLGRILEIDLYALMIYFEFSGYMDIVIGIGMLVGWTPPENFNWPYLSRNLIEFWARWHITLGEFIRDYLFNPMNLTLQRGALRGRPLLAGVASYLTVMVWCGMWHRANLQFALWGLLHGFGLAAVKIFEVYAKRWMGKKRYAAWRVHRVAGVFSGFLTFQFVAVSFLFAFYPTSEALKILGGVWWLS